MKITALSCACSRPEAWKLCERYMARQTVNPFQWLVLDDDEPMTKCTMGQEYVYCPDFRGKWSLVRKIKYALENNLVKGDAIMFWENDDWYAPTWLEFCAKNLEGYQLVGEGRAIYYNPTKRFWFYHPNMAHASLCSTAVRRSCFDVLLQCCDQSNPFVDSRLWRNVLANKMVFDPKQGPRQVVGMKGLPGRIGYGSGHVIREANAKDDPNLSFLKKLIGDDYKFYESFYHNEKTPAV